MWYPRTLTLLGIALACSTPSAEPAMDLYQRHCAECHGPDRLGRIGAALLPENLGRLRREEAAQTIAQGRAACQMQGFADKLTAEEIQALVGLVYTPLPEVPVWDLEEIRESRLAPVDPATLRDKPAFSADPLNLFVVVELGDHHATILDGDRREPIHRFPTRFALHGGPSSRPMGASSTSPPAMAASAASASTASRPSPRSAPGSTPATWRFPPTAVMSWSPTRCPTAWSCSPLWISARSGSSPSRTTPARGRGSAPSTMPRRGPASLLPLRTSPSFGRSSTATTRCRSTTAPCTTMRWTRISRARAGTFWFVASTSPTVWTTSPLAQPTASSWGPPATAARARWSTWTWGVRSPT